MVQAGTLFGYLAAFITILLALAVSDLAISLHRLLRARARVAWHPIPLLAALWMLLVLLTTFFAIWELTPLDHLSFYGLVWKITPPFFYFLAACAVLPDEVPPEGIDLYRSYQSDRRYFYSVALLGFLTDTIDGLAAGWARPAFVFLLVTIFLCLGAMLWRREKWVHWASLAGLLVTAHIGFSDWTISGASALAG